SIQLVVDLTCANQPKTVGIDVSRIENRLMKIGARPAKVIVLSQHRNVRRHQPTGTQQHAHGTVKGHAAKNTPTDVGRNMCATSMKVKGAIGPRLCRRPTAGGWPSDLKARCGWSRTTQPRSSGGANRPAPIGRSGELFLYGGGGRDLAAQALVFQRVKN